jgi:hypothetical protein
VPIILDAKLGYEVAQAIYRHRSGEILLETRELSEYWQPHQQQPQQVQQRLLESPN